jgi:hypothetical protein
MTAVNAFGGPWYEVAPSGDAVTTTTPTRSTPGHQVTSMSPTSHADPEPSFGALLSTVVYAVDAVAIGGTVCPGLLLCVPGILLFLVPLLVLGAFLALVALALAVIALPVLAIHRLWPQRSAVAADGEDGLDARRALRRARVEHGRQRLSRRHPRERTPLSRS